MAEDQDLTTVESFREYQAVSGAAADAMADRIASVITIASDSIMDFCQQRFAPIVEDEAVRFRYDGGGVLSLAPYCAQEVTAVSIDTDTDGPTVLESDAYRLAPLPARNGVFHVLHMRTIGAAGKLTDLGPTYREVTVTGTWGYLVVPPAVREACNMTVGYVLRTMSQHQGDEIDGVSAGWGGSAVLIPGNAKRLLAPYRKYAAGS